MYHKQGSRSFTFRECDTLWIKNMDLGISISEREHVKLWIIHKDLGLSLSKRA